MAEEFTDRVEEVLGLLHGLAWPILEEKDKQRIVAKVARGIDKYGDSMAGWARALGVNSKTLQSRLAHFRRSEPVDGDLSTPHPSIVKNLKYGLKHADPDTLAAVLADSATRRAVTDAIVANVREDADLRTGSPEGLKPPASLEVIGEFGALRSHAVRVVSHLGTVRMSGMLREAVDIELDRIDAAIGMARDLITDRKAADWDDALAELMEG